MSIELELKRIADAAEQIASLLGIKVTNDKFTSAGRTLADEAVIASGDLVKGLGNQIVQSPSYGIVEAIEQTKTNTPPRVPEVNVGTQNPWPAKNVTELQEEDIEKMESKEVKDKLRELGVPFNVQDRKEKVRAMLILAVWGIPFESSETSKALRLSVDRARMGRQPKAPLTSQVAFAFPPGSVPSIPLTPQQVPSQVISAFPPVPGAPPLQPINPPAQQVSVDLASLQELVLKLGNHPTPAANWAQVELLIQQYGNAPTGMMVNVEPTYYTRLAGAVVSALGEKGIVWEGEK